MGNIEAVQLLLEHSKLEGTVCYLGIVVDDAMRSPRRSKTGALRSTSMSGRNRRVWRAADPAVMDVCVVTRGEPSRTYGYDKLENRLVQSKSY